MKVIPALLTNSVDDLFAQIDRLLPFYNHFQIDIADGKFVPNTTVQTQDILSFLKKPGERYTSITLDFHLMVTDWEHELQIIKKINHHISLDIIFIHYSVLKKNKDIINKPSKNTIGIVLNPEDDISDLDREYSLNTISAIQIMSVNPGFQGSPFLPETLQKIEYLKRKDYKGKIYLDGGVNKETLSVINTMKHKPDYLGIGSFLSKADDIQERVAFLKQYEG